VSSRAGHVFLSDAPCPHFLKGAPLNHAHHEERAQHEDADVEELSAEHDERGTEQVIGFRLVFVMSLVSVRPIVFYHFA
jgi:hypothetical protein